MTTSAGEGLWIVIAGEEGVTTPGIFMDAVLLPGLEAKSQFAAWKGTIAFVPLKALLCVRL